MQSYPVWRGPAGNGISEGQQEQVDAAIAAAEYLAVALPQVEQARDEAVTAADQAAATVAAVLSSASAADAAREQAIEARDTILGMDVATGSAGTEVTWSEGVLTVPRGADGPPGSPGAVDLGDLTFATGAAGTDVNRVGNTVYLPRGADGDVTETRLQEAVAEVSLGGVIDRGDVAILATINGVPVAAFTTDGRLSAAADGRLVASVFGSASPEQADLLTTSSPFVQSLILDTALDRGDAAEIARLNGMTVLALLSSGHLDLRLSDDAVADVRARLDLDQLVALSAPLSADLAGDYDAWDVWQRGELTYFTGNLWGDRPRGYVRRGAGLPWAVAPSVMPLRLVTGDHVANALPSAQLDRWAHIATLGDGADQDGLDGAAPSGPAEDFARAGAGFAALSADRGLAARTGALARYGVRSEAVEGATLAQLAAGQPLANLVRARTEFARLAALYGGQVATESVTVLHSGGTASITAYRDALVALAGTLVEQLGAGQVNVIPPGGTWASGADPAILGAVEALRTRGAVPLVLASPIHWCGILTGSLATPDAPSMTMLAELDALATAAGTGWHGPVPYQAVRSGNTILVDCEVMPGADLVAPTYGVSYSGAAISAMAVVAEPLTGRMTRLQITLAAAAAGTLSIAFGATGTDDTRFANRCDLRDSWGAPSITGQTLRRFTHSAQFEVV